MSRKTQKAKRIDVGKLIAFTFLTCLAIIWIIPLLWIFISSFKVEMEINQAGGFMYFPKTWTLENFAELLNPNNKQLPIYRWFINSFFISGVHTILSVIVYSMSGYAYAKMQFKGRETIFLTLMGMSVFPAIINIIPLYKLCLTLGWLNGPLALIVPGLAGMFNIFLIRQFLYGIPDAMIEVARIDGANEWTIYTRVILPLAKPILIAVGLFSFTGNWNDFLWPSIAINNIDRLPVTAGLQLAKGVYGVKVAHMSAVAVIAIVPMAILYLFTQKYFINGISLSSGIKG